MELLHVPFLMGVFSSFDRVVEPSGQAMILSP